VLSIFFFSSRRRHTSWPRDWSSDVCSSDLHALHKEARWLGAGGCTDRSRHFIGSHPDCIWPDEPDTHTTCIGFVHEARRHGFERSEERRVGKGVDRGGRSNVRKNKLENQTV